MDPTGEGLPPVGSEHSIFFSSGWGLSASSVCACYLYLADRLKSSSRVVLNYTEFDNDLNKKVCNSRLSLNGGGRTGFNGSNGIFWSFKCCVMVVRCQNYYLFIYN